MIGGGGGGGGGGGEAVRRREREKTVFHNGVRRRSKEASSYGEKRGCYAPGCTMFDRWKGVSFRSPGKSESTL